MRRKEIQSMVPSSLVAPDFFGQRNWPVKISTLRAVGQYPFTRKRPATGPRCPERNCLSTRKAASVFRRRYPEMPHESPPHPFVIAEPRPLRHFDHAADVLAFE